MATLEVRNNFTANIQCEAFGPHKQNQKFMMNTLYTQDNEVLEVAKTPMQVIYTTLDVEVSKHDMIRKVMINKENVY